VKGLKGFYRRKDYAMMWNRWIASVLPALLAAFVLAGVGCDKREDKTAQATDKPAADKAEAEGHGWWCAEHGMPEAECAQCNPKLAAKLKKEGDWCKEHNRPESQCIPCHPELKEKFAAEYRAKYGKEPPPMTEESTDDSGKGKK
jgi:hypothetical protein